MAWANRQIEALTKMVMDGKAAARTKDRALRAALKWLYKNSREGDPAVDHHIQAQIDFEATINAALKAGK